MQKKIKSSLKKVEQEITILQTQELKIYSFMTAEAEIRKALEMGWKVVSMAPSWEMIRDSFNNYVPSSPRMFVIYKLPEPKELKKKIVKHEITNKTT